MFVEKNIVNQILIIIDWKKRWNYSALQGKIKSLFDNNKLRSGLWRDCLGELVDNQFHKPHDYTMGSWEHLLWGRRTKSKEGGWVHGTQTTTWEEGLAHTKEEAAVYIAKTKKHIWTSVQFKLKRDSGRLRWQRGCDSRRVNSPAVRRSPPAEYQKKC